MRQQRSDHLKVQCTTHHVLWYAALSCKALTVDFKAESRAALLYLQLGNRQLSLSIAIFIVIVFVFAFVLRHRAALQFASSSSLQKKDISTSNKFYLKKRFLPKKGKSTSKNRIPHKKRDFYLKKRFLPQKEKSTSKRDFHLKGWFLPQKRFPPQKEIFTSKRRNPPLQEDNWFGKALHKIKSSNVKQKFFFFSAEIPMCGIHNWDPISKLILTLSNIIGEEGEYIYNMYFIWLEAITIDIESW